VDGQSPNARVEHTYRHARPCSPFLQRGGAGIFVSRPELWNITGRSCDGRATWA
jgi:hypothetical protein